MFFELSFIAAFLGGLLTLLPSCGPFILPAFFAIAFKEKDRLVLMTLVLFAGFLTTFIPLGLGITALVYVFFTNIKFIHILSGMLLITLGLMSFFGVRLPIAIHSKLVPKNHDVLSIFLFGMVFGVATGSCTAPSFGAVLTVVIAQGVGLESILLLVAFALGMILPLILLAVFFDRIPEKRKQWLSRKVFTLKIGKKKRKIPLSNMLAAILFTFMGITFLFSSVQNFLQRFFESVGVTDAFLNLYSRGLSLTKNITTSQEVVFFIVIIGCIIASVIWTKKKR